MQLVFLELPKFKKTITEPHSGLERWLSYFSNEEEGKMEKIAKADPMITAAMLIESEFWANEKERDLYFAMQKQLMDESSAERSISIYAHQRGLEEGLEEGRKEGIQEGERMKALETARNLLSMGIPADKISLATGLPEDEIANLAP